MNRIKNRRIVILSLIFALVMTISLAFTTAFTTLRTADADEPADVAINGFARSAQNEFAKSEDNIFGKVVEAWGCTGWGGFAAELLTDTSYDVSTIKETGKGAISFWLYLADDGVVAAYKDMSGTWNLDVSSSKTYSDSEKVSYALNADLFAEARVGWQKIVVPLENPNENNNMDWSKFSSFRINATGCGFGSGITMKVADFVFTLTNATKPYITGDPVTTFEPSSVLVNGSQNADFSRTMTIDDLGEEVTVYFPQGWGGYLAMLSFAEPYNITVTDNSALSVWVYFQGEDDIEALSSFNVDVSSGSEYSDQHKYSFQLHRAFEMCEVGWNHVVIPLEKANEKNSMDWSDVQNIRLNVSGSKECYVGTAKYEIIQSGYDDFTVVGYVPPTDPGDEIPGNPRISCDAETGLHIDGFEEGWGDQSDHNPTSASGFYKQGTGAWSLTSLGTTSFTKTLASSFDLTEYETISFWLYVDDAARFAQMTDGQIELRSQNDDDHELNWDFRTVAATLRDGWNYVSLNLTEGSANAGFEITAVKYIRFYFTGLTGDPITTVFDDLHAHKDPAGTMIETFDNGWNGFVQQVEGHDGGFATDFSGEGWAANARMKFKNGKTVDIADYDTIGLWVYIGNDLTAEQVAGTEIELSSSGREDNSEIAFFMPAGLSVGWNHVTFKISEAQYTDGSTGRVDLTKINYFGLVKQGLPFVTMYLDDLYAFESRYYTDPVQPIEKQTVVTADVSGAFSDTEIDNDKYQEGTGAAMSAGKVGSGSFTADFGPIDTGLELNNANNKELGLALWIYLENASTVTNLTVALSSQANGGFELSWTADAAKLADGWNWLAFKASDATREGGVIDLTAVRRVTVNFNGDSGTPITIGFDCVRIVNINAENAFEPVVDRQILEPIDSLRLDDCESAWTNSGISETIKKQGYASVEISTEENDAAVTATATFNVGKTDLSVRPRQGNELGVTFWLNVSDRDAVTTVEFRIGSSESNYIKWGLENLVTGWNWVTLRASEGEVTGTVDPNGLTFVSLIVSGNAFSVNIDRVTLVNYAIAANLTEPADESVNRNPIMEKIFVDCDTVDNRFFSGNALDLSDMRQGVACVVTSGAGYHLTAKDFGLGKTDLTCDTVVLAFWLWIQDITLYDSSDVDAQVELTSSGTYDKNEINWSLNKWKDGLKDGWNWIVLKGTDADIEGGLPDFDNLNFFRIYINNIANSTIKLDRVTIGYIGNTALFSEPDWESELAGAGEYQGPNGSGSLNAPYLDTDFSNPDSYSWTESEEYTYKEEVNGCKSEIAAVDAAVAVAVIAAGALAIVLHGRKRGGG